jgi:beta-mannosidase
MIRLWGGGIYEPEVFYDLCDGQTTLSPPLPVFSHDVLLPELGLLVWQDFQFACGVYPAHDKFVESVRQEAVQVVRRLRRHPSTALFCGNNEGLRLAVHVPTSVKLTRSIDYQQVLQWGDVADLPARKLYEDVLPGVVARYAPEVAYHRGSPYGGAGWDTADPTIGDVHQWDVWAGKGLPFQDYDRLGGRFVRSALVLLSGIGADVRDPASSACRRCPPCGPSSTGWAPRRTMPASGARRGGSWPNTARPARTRSGSPC